LVALEIDDADLALVTATTMPDRRVSTVATSTAALLRLGQRLVRPVRRKLVIDQCRLETQSRCYRSECLNRHILLFSFRRIFVLFSRPTQARNSRALSALRFELKN